MGSHSFETEALLLVLPSTDYQQRVPIAIGTTITDMAVEFISKFKPENLSKSWKAVCCATQSKWLVQAQPENKFLIRTTKSVTLPPFSTTTIRGCTKLRSHGMRLNLIAEPSNCTQLPTSVQCTPTYCTLEPGSNRVSVGIKNISSRAITIPSRVVVGRLQQARMVPDDQSSKSKQDPTGGKGGSWILDQLNLEGLNSWTREQQQSARDLLVDSADVFAKTDLDLGKCNIIKHAIKITDPQPFKECYRRIPPHLYEEVKAHLQEMVEVGAIRKSFSPWASAVVLVRKKDGGLRFCIDLRKLNNRTVKDGYSLPRIEDTLDCLHGAVWFSTLDLKSGYWQVELEEEAKPLTAFTVGPLGFWECEHMPFGLTNAPATFQRLMESCLGELHLNWCIIYLDDIIVFSRTPEEHIHRLRAVFEKLKAAGLKLKPSKCDFFKKEIKYLGHVVSEQGVSTDPGKIKAVTEWPQPTTVTEVRSFLGFVSYYRRFIPNFSKVAKPLNQLLQNLEGTPSQKKKFKVHWGPEQQEAFETLQRLCTESPVLAYADFKAPFILHTDASGEGLGAVLYQVQEGKQRVIAYASRSLSKSEKNYPVHKLEFLALKWAITDKFHEYLYGSQFQVYTDNNPLTYVLTTAKLDATGHRWVAALSNYTFSIIYKPGKGHKDADALSCIRWPEAMELDSQTVHAVCEGVQAPHGKVETLCQGAHVVDALSKDRAPPGMTSLEWCHIQAQDPILSQIIREIHSKTLGKMKIKMGMPSELKALIRNRTQLTLKHGVLYKKTKVNARTKQLLVVPQSYRQRAMEGCHDQVGHLGQDRVLDLLRDRFYWPGMHADVVSYINSCPRCLRRKSQQDKAPLVNIETSQPLELIHLDYLKIEPSKGNIENVLVITDHFTRYAQAFPSKTQTALATAKLLWNNFILHYGFPEKIITDQGRNFESELIGHLCQLAGVQKLRTSPYHPQTNGQCERFNGTLLNMLGTLTPEQKKDWKSHVPALVHAYNCTRNTATGFSPYFLLFGREPRLPVDVEFGLQRGGQKGSPGESNYISQLKKRLQFAYRKAKCMAQKQQARHRGLYNLRCRGATLSVGDLVLVKQTAWKGRHKIQDRWEDREYQVVDQPTPGIPVYTVKSLTGGQTKILHRNLLLPLQGRLRQEGETVGEGVTDSEEEEEEKAVTPCVTRAPKGGPTNTPKPQDDLTPVESEASLMTDLSFHSLDGDSNEENAYDSLTSHTTVSSSTSADFQSTETNSPISDSITESQFSTVMPYQEDSGQTSTEVFTETSNTEPHTSQQLFKSLDISETTKVNETPPPSPIPRRSTRSTRGAPPVHFGRVITHSTRVSNMFDSPVYRQTLFVSSIPTILLV